MQSDFLKVLRRCARSLAAVLMAVAAANLAAEAAAAGTLERIRQNGKIVLGYRVDARPFSFRDDSGAPAGYAVALCKQIAAQVKSELALPALTLEWVAFPLAGRAAAIKEGRVDLLCEAESETLARRQEVDFSIPIFPGGVGALLRADAALALRNALAGRPSGDPVWRGAPARVLAQKTFSAIEGSTGLSWLTEWIELFHLSARVVPVKSYEAGIRRVLERSTDAFFGERAILLDAAQRGPAAGDLRVLDHHFTHERLALALPRNDDDFRLLIDRTLSRLYRAPGFAALYADWFGPLDADAQRFFQWSALPD